MLRLLSATERKGLGVHELLIPSPHHGVEVVGGMLLPELAQHELLVARLDALHGALLRLPWCFASAALRSGRHAKAGAPLASAPASSAVPPVPRAPARLQGREQQQQGVRPRPERRGRWEGLRAWVWACSWNQVVYHGAWGRAGRALAPAAAGLLARRAGQEPAQELAQPLQHRPRAARQQPPPLSGSSLPSLCSKHLLPRARPTSPSAVEVYAEADARASEVDDVTLVVRQLEAEVPQGDGASQVHHVVLVGVGFHDVPHALLADDLGDDVVAQRAHRVRGVGQAAAAEVNFRVRHHLHEGENLLIAGFVDETRSQ